MHPRIACIGGATLDRRLEPLGPLRTGTSNPVRSAVSAGGTARNVAEALARLGCPVSLYCRVGIDAEGARVVDELAGAGADVSGIERRPGLPTASYTAVLDEAGELVFGLADMEILDRLEDGWLEDRLDRLAACDLWILDANLPASALERLVRAAPERVRILADPVSVEKSRRLVPILDRIHTIFPDRAEAAALAGSDSPSELEADPRPEPAAVAAALRRLGPERVIVTLGAEGVWVEDPPRHERLAAAAAGRVVDVTGAGDCFLAAFVFAELADAALDPVRCGLAAAALAIESPRPVPEKLSTETLLARYQAQAIIPR